ncbi:Peptidase S8/S53 subtilisin kexin sedolisin [Ignavibacterium album JCM 16511]|uniref:Peptidase S8/S53 subtilisin kexin sedolisin n=1 Tax=Ignavibacterium album (strain DSM 19864 / JCM 16511 / NBRC 101810 / Mat9-16) TaxID=945713 RepID=I0AGH5_IGNAJ|nr:T9SS type A sorting domain-containing protein [Ignavibacterium album]AFH48082.1 Peptidase S8/S53 subtilisin kexin sedolisin [Ignavibacterium album JCM 16511]
MFTPGGGDFTLTYKIRAKDIGNHYSDFSVGVITRAEFLGKDITALNSGEFRLMENYPNPFNPSTKISWQSPVGSWQTLKVYDMLGREVATLVDEYRQAGNYEIEFNASNLPSGVYISKPQAGEFVQNKKMILTK